ncbi:hypothetical protein Cgig2_002569 [Carnegiea gigantea]|uniref:Uncharacterized protein n=1 Tax=Carnegiea gigantea TaxID=171969 RepID=A0A9Q1GKR4_9CARY|nr:hypothetical protein Cgig2_002569 [Carnegiea gigantea]
MDAHKQVLKTLQMEHTIRKICCTEQEASLIDKLLRSWVQKIRNELPFLQMFRETHKKGTDFATPEIAQKYVHVYVLCNFENESQKRILCFTWMINKSRVLNWQITEKVFKSKSQSQVLDIEGGVKRKDIRRLYSTRAELEVEFNATRRKNEVFTDRLAPVEAKNKKLQNHVESVETEMIKVKDLLFQHFNTRPPSVPHDGDGTPG